MKKIIVLLLFLLSIISVSAHSLDMVYSELNVYDSTINYSVKISPVHLADLMGFQGIENLTRNNIDTKVVENYFSNNFIIE